MRSKRLKMSFRLSIFAFCCLVAVNCISQGSENYNNNDYKRNDGSQSSVAGGSSFREFGNEKVNMASTSHGDRGIQNEERNQRQGSNFGSHNSNEGQFSGQSAENSRNPSNFGGQSSGHTNNRETNQNFGGVSQNNREQSQSFGGSSQSNTGGFDNRPNRPNYQQESIDRPVGSSGHGGHRPSSSSRPEAGSFHGQTSEYRPDNNREQSSNRPTGGSFQNTHQSHGGNRPSGSVPNNVGEHSSGRPTSGATSHNEGNRRPTGITGTTSSHNEGDRRPSGISGTMSSHNEGDRRPTGITGTTSSHNEGDRRPTGESIHGQQTGTRPGEHGGQSGHLPTGSEQNQFSTSGTNEQKHGNKNEKDSEKEDGKEDGKEDDKDVCFPNLGCFKMGKPWKSLLRPIGPPHGPEKIQTTIHFYSRQNLEKQKNITVYPEINMGEARFDPRKITAMIVHGFSNSGNATWMKDMKNVYLDKVDANVMIVDWGKGAQLLNYLQVAGNTRVVGKQLGLFVKYLIEHFGADPGKFHLIGHSLGAQICSYLAKEVPGMARLTALDPAQPGFEGFDSELRLDKTDAEFVDVIHTDARPFIPTLGFGMIAPHGHVDFYMNGGFDQPGCIPPPKKELPSIKSFLDFAKYPVEVIAKTVACPHGRAYEYLIEAFNETEKCIFWGHKADAKNVFKSVTNTVTQGLLKKFTALSTTCSKEDCIPVGFATKKSPLRGIFVVTTGSRSPYCISEPGIPPETPPQERKQESFIQKIGKKTGLIG